MPPLTGQAVHVQDGGAAVDLAHPVGKDLALGLGDDVPLGDHHQVRHLQHRADLLRGVHPGEVVDDADRQHPLDMRGAAVAKPGALYHQQVELPLQSPGQAVPHVAHEEMVGAEVPRQPGADRHPLLLEERLVLGRQRVELDDADGHPLGLQRGQGLDGDGGLPRGRWAGYGHQLHGASPWKARRKEALVSDISAFRSLLVT